MVTFNDHTMVRVMLLLRDIADSFGPFSGELIDELNFSALNSSLNLGMDYILNSQIIVDGELTIWCQQHDPETYEPMTGRPYELLGRSAWESSGVTALLLNWPERTNKIENATRGAVQWFHDNVIIDKSYIYETPGYWENGNITDSEGGMLWYRYYNLSDNQFFMAGRDSVKVYQTEDLTREMKTSYTWGGDWGRGIIVETSKMGFSAK
jgi:PelA/Pel-15E family pectate lyase